MSHIRWRLCTHVHAAERILCHEWCHASQMPPLATFAERDIRLDGMPRSNATPKGPAVMVGFESSMAR